VQNPGIDTLADGRDVVTADSLSTLRAVARILDFVGDFNRAWHTCGKPEAIVERAMAARGLSALVDDYRDAVQSLEEIEHLDAVMFALIEDRAPGSRLVERALARWPFARQRPVPVERLVTAWCSQRMPRVQQLLEAFPREADDSASRILKEFAQKRFSEEASERAATSAVALSDQLSEVFHGLLTAVYESLGAAYYPVRLYRDDAAAAANAPPLRHTLGAYPFQCAEELVRAGVEFMPGAVIRVCRPVIEFRAERAYRSRWDGVLEFAGRLSTLS
jgi:hypothetical protein